MHSPDSFISREAMLRKRALDVLGFSVPQGGPPPFPDKRELQYRYHCRMLKHHPDRAPHDAGAHDVAACINEAFALLSGRRVQATLLLDDALVQRLVDDPVTPLDGAPTYREWLETQFYEIENKSIWSW